MKIRVATYNIHKGVSSIGNRPRVLALKKAIGMFGADVVFLQEVQGKHDHFSAKFGAETRGRRQWPEGAQHEFLMGEMPHSAYGMNAIYDHGHHGNALLSKLAIASQSNDDVSDHAYESRGILHCILETEVGKVHCYVVHLGLFESGRGRQTDLLIQKVLATAPAGEPVIIAGDFNDWRNNLSARLRESLGVCEVFDELGKTNRFADLARRLSGRSKAVTPAKTFPAAMPFLRLDRMYVRGFAVEKAEVLHGPTWARLSDHAPIVANLALL